MLLRTDILQKTMVDMPLLIRAMISVASKPNDLVENARRNLRPPVLMERLTTESRCCKSREVIFGRVYVPDDDNEARIYPSKNVNVDISHSRHAKLVV